MDEIAHLADQEDTMTDQPETPADLYDRLRPIVTALDPTETDDNDRHHRLRYRPTAAELTAARDALRQLHEMPDRHIMDPATTGDVDAAGWERLAAELDAAEAAKVLDQFAADLAERGITVPHLFGPRTLAAAALERIDADLRTPDQWQQITGTRIIDADGWTGPDPRPWTEPIGITEWQRRMSSSTIDTTGAPVPTGRQCDALCRDIETDLDRMTPVVDAARAFRRTPNRGEVAIALLDAVDAYEATPGIAPSDDRLSADDVQLTGPADTPLGRATVALAAWLDQFEAELTDAEELAKVALDAAFPDDGYHQPDYADPSWSAPADHRAEATALLQVATEPPETRDWTADPTHVLLAAIAHAILATVPAPQPAAEQGNAEVDRLRAGLLDRSIQPDPWATLPEDVIDTALAAIDRLLRLVQAAADWRGRYVAAGSPDWPLHGPIATALDELLRDWPGVDLSVPAAGGEDSGEVFDADDYPEDYPDDGGMPRNPATPPVETAVEWGVRVYYRDGTTSDHWRDGEDDARESVRTIRRCANDEEWSGADLIRRTASTEPWEVVPDGPETAPSATHSPEQPSAGTTGPANPAQGN